jgi:hypothetical protein
MGPAQSCTRFGETVLGNSSTADGVPAIADAVPAVHWADVSVTAGRISSICHGFADA